MRAVISGLSGDLEEDAPWVVSQLLEKRGLEGLPCEETLLLQ